MKINSMVNAAEEYTMDAGNDWKNADPDLVLDDLTIIGR